MRPIFCTLQAMMGDRQRCMYCLDSHGSDIDHFWPKSPYPERAFIWANLLLSCTPCGRLKGDLFPLDNDRRLLIDPTSENPWDFIDFDPVTGNLTARYDLAANQFDRKGSETVGLLHLSRREALATGYRRTWARLVAVVHSRLSGELEPDAFLNQLLEADDHALLGWCFDGIGINESPFREWGGAAPDVWAACAERIRGL